MRWYFWIGIAMIGYDMLGHATALTARLTGARGAFLWNTYAGYVWPRWADSVTYDAYWTLFFGTAILLILRGR
jgi:hypothetical protein